MGTPRLAELKGFTHGHPAKRAELGFTFRSVPPLGPLGRQPPVMAGSRKDQVGVGAGGGCVPVSSKPSACKVPAPLPRPFPPGRCRQLPCPSLQPPVSSQRPQEGAWLQGPGQAPRPQPRACSARPMLHFASPPPLTPPLPPPPSF